MSKTLNALIYKDIDCYVAECPEVGTISCGDTVESALATLKEVTVSYLEDIPVILKSDPFLTTFEINVNSKVLEKNILNN